MTDQNTLISGSYRITKRILDTILSVIALPMVIPVIILFGIWVKIDSKGPIFYSQIRLGKDGKEFRIFKLRSMVNNAEKNSGAVWALKEDPRITKVGKIIRRFRIDELPQFINVILGDMSLVGPRPERPDLTILFSKDIPGFEKRLEVKPGITGLAQVNGGYDISPKDKLVYDLQYIDSISLKNDVLILIKTIKVILFGHGAR